MKPNRILFVVFVGFFFFGLKDVNREKSTPDLDLKIGKEYNEEDIEVINLTGGCFWGVEKFFYRIDGVVDTVSAIY